MDLIETAKEASMVINVMKVERDDPSVWKELYERGKQLAADVDIEPRIPRTAGRQQHRVNIPACRNARDVLAKSRIFSFGRSPRARTN